MSWLRALEIGLDITNVAVNLSNASRLNELQRLGQSAELRMTLARELRNQVFGFRQASDAALEMESVSVFRTAAAMKLLQQRLRETQITPDDFDEFADKEYVHTVTKHISDNTSRLYYQCSVEERDDIDEVVTAITHLPDYEYFLTHYEDFQRYGEVKRIVDEFSGRNESGAGFGVGYVRFFLVVTLLVFGGMSNSGVVWVFVIAAIIGANILISRWQNAGAFKDAKTLYDALLLRINVNRMGALERQLRTIENAQQRRQEAQWKIKSVFGQDTPIMIR
jgi:hypothetical protein